MDTVDTLIVSIGKEEPEYFDWPWFYIHTENWHDVDLPEVHIRDRIQYRANRRNEAVQIGLEKFPDAMRIMMVDSYYLGSLRALKALIKRHDNAPYTTLGPVIWGSVRTNLSELFYKREMFYDGWSTPELRWCPFGWRPDKDVLVSQEQVPMKGLYQVSSIGGCYIFPRKIWDNGARYGVPFGVHGCEHNYFHQQYSWPKYVDFEVELFRLKSYPFVKLFKVSLGNWRRTR